jgi:hypothetical protein
MRVIRDDLHCTAVRITGGDPDRLELAATYAFETGLEVWFARSPMASRRTSCSTCSSTAPSGFDGAAREAFDEERFGHLREKGRRPRSSRFSLIDHVLYRTFDPCTGFACAQV